jgi:hypothetical protein
LNEEGERRGWNRKMRLDIWGNLNLKFENWNKEEWRILLCQKWRIFHLCYCATFVFEERDMWIELKKGNRFMRYFVLVWERLMNIFVDFLYCWDWANLCGYSWEESDSFWVWKPGRLSIGPGQKRPKPQNSSPNWLNLKVG